jgi:hypothetical protein
MSILATFAVSIGEAKADLAGSVIDTAGEKDTLLRRDGTSEARGLKPVRPKASRRTT